MELYGFAPWHVYLAVTALIIAGLAEVLLDAAFRYYSWRLDRIERVISEAYPHRFVKNHEGRWPW